MHEFADTKILIADGNVLFRDQLVVRLSDHCAATVTAGDTETALALAMQDGITLVLTAFDLPGEGGVRLCEHLKGSPDTRSIPVVIMGGRQDDAVVEDGFRAGAAGFVAQKNIEEELLPALWEVLDRVLFVQERLVLVVDDSPSIRAMVAQGLGEVGFQVQTASDGAAALSMLNKGIRPDLILCDIEMPHMSGIELCTHVREMDDCVAIPFVTMSSHDDRGVVRGMLHRGADAYLVKPFQVDQMVSLVERMLSDQYLIMFKDIQRLESERNLMLASITSLVTALEARDGYTRGHSESVARILGRMAATMGFTPEDRETLVIAGRLHDVGKIGVPDGVLLKPGKLTYEEFEIIKRHPATGAAILETIPALEQIVPVILHHHERLDGMGYPDGLKGNEIPLWARMTAVADTYDALTSDRPYRKGMDKNKALQIIADIRHDQLCPECVDAFFASVDN